jgi:penicillin-binding protein 1A
MRQRPVPAGVTLAVALVVGSGVLGTTAAVVLRVGSGFASDSVHAELPEPGLAPLALRSVVYDVHGTQLAVLHGGKNRAPVTLDSLPDHLVHAVLAAEDRNFYEHDGVDWQGVGRALLRNLDAGAVEEGGSTITQQLVKNTMFDAPERDIERKAKEAVLAMGLERRYGKDEILEQYLSTIYLGNGAYGVTAAAERYFAKAPTDLTLGEAALLAAMIANPAERDPVEHPDEAARARRAVLDAMSAAGWADDRAAAAAAEEALPTALRPVALDPVSDPFVEEVKRALLRDERLGASYDARYRRVFEGGLRIHTTYDPRLQVAAELAVRNVLPPDVPYTASLVAIDNATGAVRAMVPGTSFQHAGFNLATQGARQTGSAFKAITLTAAIEHGFSPHDRVDASGQCTFHFDDTAPAWNVHNYDGDGMGRVDLTEAIARSSNCAFARVALALGADKIVDTAHRLGIRRELLAVPSITLGTQPVSPLEMAAAFSTLANEGVHKPPRFVERVETRDGEVLFEERPAPQPAVDPEVARTVTSMLTEVVEDGTGTRADIGRPVAGKTGTNQAYRDAWFAGYTPQYTAAVWIGDPAAQVPVVIEGTSVTGGSYPAQIWHDFMAVAHDGLPVIGFTPPDERLWPPGGYVSERGRSAGSRSSPVAPPEGGDDSGKAPTIVGIPDAPEPVTDGDASTGDDHDDTTPTTTDTTPGTTPDTSPDTTPDTTPDATTTTVVVDGT